MCLFAACGVCDIQHAGRGRSSQAGLTGACHTDLEQRYCSQLEQAQKCCFNKRIQFVANQTNDFKCNNAKAGVSKGHGHYKHFFLAHLNNILLKYAPLRSIVIVMG
jgi:hypothetical protein